MSSDELQLRVQTLEEAMQLLVQIARRHDTRFDELTATMDNLGERVTALVDAQIRTEDALAGLTESQRRTDEAMKEMAESQQRTGEAMKELAETQRRTDGAMKELAESQQRTDGRLNALIDIIAQGRNGGDSPA